MQGDPVRNLYNRQCQGQRVDHCLYDKIEQIHLPFACVAMGSSFEALLFTLCAELAIRRKQRPLNSKILFRKIATHIVHKPFTTSSWKD
jgi:hypothetical protein